MCTIFVSVHTLPLKADRVVINEDEQSAYFLFDDSDRELSCDPVKEIRFDQITETTPYVVTFTDGVVLQEANLTQTQPKQLSEVSLQYQSDVFQFTYNRMIYMRTVGMNVTIISSNLSALQILLASSNSDVRKQSNCDTYAYHIYEIALCMPNTHVMKETNFVVPRMTCCTSGDILEPCVCTEFTREPFDLFVSIQAMVTASKVNLTLPMVNIESSGFINASTIDIAARTVSIKGRLEYDYFTIHSAETIQMDSPALSNTGAFLIDTDDTILTVSIPVAAGDYLLRNIDWMMSNSQVTFEGAGSIRFGGDVAMNVVYDNSDPAIIFDVDRVFFDTEDAIISAGGQRGILSNSLLTILPSRSVSLFGFADCNAIELTNDITVMADAKFIVEGNIKLTCTTMVEAVSFTGSEILSSFPVLQMLGNSMVNISGIVSRINSLGVEHTGVKMDRVTVITTLGSLLCIEGILGEDAGTTTKPLSAYGVSLFNSSIVPNVAHTVEIYGFVGQISPDSSNFAAVQVEETQVFNVTMTGECDVLDGNGSGIIFGSNAHVSGSTIIGDYHQQTSATGAPSGYGLKALGGVTICDCSTQGFTTMPTLIPSTAVACAFDSVTFLTSNSKNTISCISQPGQTGIDIEGGSISGIAEFTGLVEPGILTNGIRIGSSVNIEASKLTLDGQGDKGVVLGNAPNELSVNADELLVSGSGSISSIELSHANIVSTRISMTAVGEIQAFQTNFNATQCIINASIRIQFSVCTFELQESLDCLFYFDTSEAVDETPISFDSAPFIIDVPEHCQFVLKSGAQFVDDMTFTGNGTLSSVQLLGKAKVFRNVQFLHEGETIIGDDMAVTEGNVLIANSVQQSQICGTIDSKTITIDPAFAITCPTTFTIGGPTMLNRNLITISSAAGPFRLELNTMGRGGVLITGSVSNRWNTCILY